MTCTVAIVLKGYPRLSETFIAQELHALERRGLVLRLYSLRHPADPAVHPVHREVRAPVAYLPEYLKDEPPRVRRGWRRARHMPGYHRAWRAFLKDLARDRSPNRLRRFGQACILAAELPEDVARLHAHFLHTPASVTRYAALMTGLSWSASAHAKDLWTTPDWEKRDKLQDAEWVTTCSAAGRDHLTRLTPAPEKVLLAYHGIDLDRFAAPRAQRPPHDGSSPDRAVILLSVGRAVEKKGYDDLLEALARLPTGLHWRFVHVGGGPLRAVLQARAERLGLGPRIEWRGAQAQQQVIEQYHSADLFILACRVARDGDRDGLPNVLMEAQSQGLACLSTTVSAIPELIEHETTGVLVAPGDPAALSAELEQLIRAPETRARLGAAGARRVRERFAMDPGIDALAARFGLPSAVEAAQ